MSSMASSLFRSGRNASVVKGVRGYLFFFAPLQFSPRPCPLKTLHPTGLIVISADTRSCLDVDDMDVQGLLDVSEDKM